MLLASGRNGVSVQTRRLLVLDVESLGRQCSELEDPISFPQLPPFPAVVMIFYLLYPHHPQIFIGVVWLVEVCGHRFVQFLRCDVGPVAIHPDVQGIFCLSHILLVTLVTADHVHDVFCFTCKLVPDGVSPARGITGKSVGVFY